MRGSTRRATRVAAYVASGALAVTGTILAVSPAEAAPTYDSIGVDSGARWLAGQLTNGIVHNDAFDFDDIALSADFAFGLDAVGGQDAKVDAIVDAIEPKAHDGWYTNTYQGETTTYAGSIAKLLVLVQQTGGTPASFGGHNLVTLLDDQVATAAPIAGRLENTNDQYGDANTIGQAYAAHGLKTASSANTAAVTSFLLEQQCSSGYFRLNFNPSKSAADQSCVDGTSTPDTDATAIAILQLESQKADSAVSLAITKAKTWLAGQQKSDGSFGGGTSTEASNSNSTGLAALALGGTDSEEAARWLRSRQVTGYNTCDKLSNQRGAVAYGNSGFADGRADGITSKTRDEWRRSTAQALPGLMHLVADDTPSSPSLSAASGYLKAGSRRILTTRGVRSGDHLCLTGPRTSTKGTASGTTWKHTVTLPAGTADRRYAVRDTAGHADAVVVKVLGAKTLPMRRSKYEVKRSHVVYVTIAGLAPGEIARIDYRGSIVRRGAASAKGEFTARFHVGRSLGKKTVTGYGQFTDIRRGQKVIKVVR
jgi:hypothetical protein